MPLDWKALQDTVGDAGNELLDVLKPYLPALAREGPDVFEGFIKHLTNSDWAKIDELMYKRMTQAERDKLDEQVYKDLVNAARAKFRRKELVKEVALKVVLRVALGSFAP